MECTQRLECTQDAYDDCSERAFPEQIGFLGICGTKHPIKKGPNKVGRDPQTCSIILNDNSISRQHAVINILNKKDFMLMDLDSSNKTKLLDKTLQPYIPQPLKNGDTVQFGQLFGIFRLFEEDDDLPMTQAVEIPETPVYSRNTSRLKPAQITTVPESPDISDRDDSIIAQPPKRKIQYKSPNNNLIKPSKKMIETQGISTNKINNVYWASSRKSDSFNSNFESNSSYTINRNSNDPKKLTLESTIYDMETQVPGQPSVDETSHSIYEADTQVPSNKEPMNIYNCETQITTVEKLPEVFKVRGQNNVELNLYSTSKTDNIFEAETQVLQHKEKKLTPTVPSVNIVQKNDAISDVHKKLNSSDEEICFDEIDCIQNEDECGSQPLLPPDLDSLGIPIEDKEKPAVKEKEKESVAVSNDSETKDCDEIAPSQMVIETKDDEDLTDFEDNMIELVVNKTNQPHKVDDDETDCEDDVKTVKQKPSTCDDDLTDCEDDVIEISQNTSKVSNLPEGFDDLPTQVISEKRIDTLQKSGPGSDDVPFDEMLTQVIDECPIESNVVDQKENNTNKSIPFEDLETQVLQLEIPQEQSSSASKQIGNYNNFKLPMSSPTLRKKPVMSLKTSKSPKLITSVNIKSNVRDDQNYYCATQEIFNDLCTQTEQSDTTPKTKNEKINLTKERNILTTEKQSEYHDDTRNIDIFVSRLSKEQVRNVIGVNEPVATLSKKQSSDSSDLEVTPKKFNVSKFLMIDLPDSQDIKSCDFITSKVDHTDSSDGLEDEENSQNSPQVSTKKTRRKKDITLDLMTKFDVNTLPTRAITRIRKPTSKILDSDSSSKRMTERILQSNLGLDKEHEIDGEIVELNLKRLRSKMEKAKNKTSSRNTKSGVKVIDATSNLVQTENSLRSSDKTESKEYKLLQKTEKVLQQKNMKEPTSKGKVVVEMDRNGVTKSTDSSKEQRRSSRNRSKKDKEITERKPKDGLRSSETQKPSSHSSRSKPSNPTDNPDPKETNDFTKSTETVRRSRRNKSSKDKIEDKKDKLQRNISAVYNLSSEVADDSSTNLKRQASSDILASNTKRAKSSNAENTSVRSLSLRGVKTQYVLFTAFPNMEVKQKLEKLGAVIVTDVKKCTVLLTLHIKRTFKLLCAVGLGKPIVGPTWVQACADSNMIVDPWLYLLKDEVSEKRFGFNLRQSLTCKRNYLRGCSVYCTPNVMPRPEEMKIIVECSGGAWKEGGRSWYCVTCQTDKAMWPELRRRGAVTVSTEFVLAGVLQQRMNLERDRLQ